MTQSVQVVKSKASSAPRRLRGLDALRGLAALAVVLFHYTTGYEARFGPYASRPLFYMPNGHFGVELFFCISGFVILGTLDRTANLKRFAIARLARIYPAYLVCVILSLATIHLAQFNVPSLMNAKSLAWNATMLTGLSGVPAIDPSYWTLTYEVVFYAAAAVICSFSRPRLEIPCLAWLACSLVGHWSPWVEQHHRLSVLLNIDFANLFVVGMMLYYLSQGSRNRLTIPTLCAALAMALFPPVFNGGRIPQNVFVPLIISFATVIWLVAHTRGRFLDIKPLVFLGEISYSLYLIHQMVGFAIIRVLFRAGVGTNIAILFTISLMIGIAYGLRIFVEKPAERWLKNLAKPHTSDPPKPPQPEAYLLART
jgi:peptidoglycan/LPS O-acetylase OafA/YrhL